MLCTQIFHYHECLNFMTKNPDVYTMIMQGPCLVSSHSICSVLFLLLFPSKLITSLNHPCYSLVILLMAPFVQIDLNGSQALLSHDDVIEDLKAQG